METPKRLKTMNETIPPVGQRPWDVWQNSRRCVELIEALGKPENAWGGRLPDWMPDFSSVLDVGCGAGVFYPVLTSKGAAYTGADTSEPMIQLCGMRFPEAKTWLADLLGRLPFCDDSFDLVLCNSVLIHIPLSLETMLAELRRVACHWVLYNVFVGYRDFLVGEVVVRSYQDMEPFLEKGKVVESLPTTIAGELCETWQVLEKKDA
jgi:SAM-dependent methyltransferase